MAVEKLYMMNVIGRLEDVDEILLKILETESVDFVSAMRQFSMNRDIYTLEEENLDKVLDLNRVEPFRPDRRLLEEGELAKNLMDHLDLDWKDGDQPATKEDIDSDFNLIYDPISRWNEKIRTLEDELKEKKRFEVNFSRFRNVDIPLKDINNLQFFERRYGLLDREGRLRLKSNYGNMLAFIFHTGSFENEEVYLLIYPKEVSEEIDRILRSLNWMDIDIGDAEGTAEEEVQKVMEEQKALEQELDEAKKNRKRFLKKNMESILQGVHGALLREQIEETKKFLAHSSRYFILSGWVSEQDGRKIEGLLSPFDDITFQLTDRDEQGKNPPTKLKNPVFFRPFELLVKMYGTPNYRELDPTVFVGITYCILFGSMFGDVGQGALFVLAGLFIGRTKNKAFGGLLSRMGISSVIFGFLYGSVFGNEELLPAIWIKPFDNINKILIISIAFGVVLLTISYIFGIVNNLKDGNREEALLGKEGLAGLAVFWAFILLALDLLTKQPILPRGVIVGIIIVALLASVFKVPIMAKLEKKKIVYPDGDKSGYYIEGGFSLLEMLISILSGTVSFIRVGAFAINHVGLFLAFQTMANMVPVKGLGILILILGNMLIIGLEGLIVFIQGLRLEYYELFSRYYKGDGYEFKPAGLYRGK